MWVYLVLPSATSSDLPTVTALFSGGSRDNIIVVGTLQYIAIYNRELKGTHAPA